MNTNKLQSITKPISSFGVLFVWIVVLLISDLPDAIWQALAGANPVWLIWVKAGIMLLLIILSWVWKRLYSLRSFFILLLLLTLGLKAIRWLRMTPSYMQGVEQAGWLFRMAASGGIWLLLVAVMVAALLVMGRRRQDFFLIKGDLKKWKVPGVILAFSVMILTFLFFDYKLPPAALLFAALFALSEEMVFRATLLSSIHDVVGKDHAIMITAVLFGMAHYFGGTPPRLEGALITAFLGWLWATMMLETRGVFMSWLNHFLNNVPTLIFWAIASISR
jgi:membrane protease YdiL (CAAX protease family)